MALGSTQPLTEMSTRNISWGKGGRCVVLTTLPPSCVNCLEIWEPQPPGTLWACNGIALLFFFFVLLNIVYFFLVFRVSHKNGEVISPTALIDWCIVEKRFVYV